MSERVCMACEFNDCAECEENEITGVCCCKQPEAHIVGAGGWRACDTAADWAGSDTAGVTCTECLEAAGVS